MLLKRALERSPSDPEAFNLIDGSLTDESNRYELRALEAVLKFVAGGLENQFRVLAGAVNTVLHDLSQGASEEALQRLIPLKLALSAFGVQVRAVHRWHLPCQRVGLEQLSGLSLEMQMGDGFCKGTYSTKRIT